MYTAEKYSEKKSIAQAKLDAWRDVSNASKPKAEVDGAKKALDTAIGEYNKLVVSDAYEALFLKGDAKEVPAFTDAGEYLKGIDPIGKAFKAYRFSGLLGFAVKRDKDTGRIANANLTIVTADDRDDKKQVYRLKDIEEKWDELQAKAEKKASLMHLPTWSALVLRMKNLFTDDTTVRCGMEIPSGLTADRIVYDDKGNKFEVGSLTKEQIEALQKKPSIGALKAELQELVDAVYFDNTDRKNGSNKYRVVEKDVHWLKTTAHDFNQKTHDTHMMTEAKAFELAFCLIAHVVTKEQYKAVRGE